MNVKTLQIWVVSSENRKKKDNLLNISREKHSAVMSLWASRPVLKVCHWVWGRSKVTDSLVQVNGET